MLTFRSATLADAPAMTALLRASGLPLDGVDDLLARDASQFIVADAADEGVVAMAGVEECCEHALLRSVAVRHDWQKRGIGQQLVQQAVHHAESRGIHALYLLTMTAEHYFPRFGFERVAREVVPPAVANTVEFTSACPASAVTMRRVLGPAAGEGA